MSSSGSSDGGVSARTRFGRRKAGHLEASLVKRVREVRRAVSWNMQGGNFGAGHPAYVGAALSAVRRWSYDCDWLPAGDFNIAAAKAVRDVHGAELNICGRPTQQSGRETGYA